MPDDDAEKTNEHRSETRSRARLRRSRCPSSDVRRKRPPALSFLLRMEHAAAPRARGLAAGARLRRRSALAIFVALSVKAVLLEHCGPARRRSTRRGHRRLRVPADGPALRALGALRGPRLAPGLRGSSPRCSRSRSSRSSSRSSNGEEFSSLLHLLRLARSSRSRSSRSLRWAYEWLTGVILRAAGYQRRAVLVGTGDHIEASRHALRDSAHTAISVVGFISLTPRPDERAALARRARRPRRRSSTAHRIDEVIIADPDFPEDDAVELVDRCHARGVRVRIAPSTMELLIHRAEFVARRGGPAVRAQAAGLRGLRLRDQADVRPRRSPRCSLVVLSPLLLAMAARVRCPRAGRSSTARCGPGIGGEPFACLKFRTMYRDADQRQADLESLNEATGALFKMRDDPRMTPVGRVPAPLLARRAAAAAERPARRDVARRARGRCPSATSTASRSGTRSATSSSRASPGCGRSPGARSWTSTTSCASTSSTSSAGRSSSISRSS